MTMRTILISEPSRRTTDTDIKSFASVISVSAPEGRSELLVSVLLESGYGREEKEYLIPLDMLEEVGIRLKGMPYEIDGETLDALAFSDAVAYALRRAYGIISYGACSYKRLERKLREKGVDREAAARAIDIVKDKGYIDESELAIRLCELSLRKYWGRARILRKLREELYSDEAIDVATEYLDTVDFAEACAELIEKRYMSIPKDRYEMQKMFASISRYGYSGSEIREAVRLFNSRI